MFCLFITLGSAWAFQIRLKIYSGGRRRSLVSHHLYSTTVLFSAALLYHLWYVCNSDLWCIIIIKFIYLTASWTVILLLYLVHSAARFWVVSVLSFLFLFNPNNYLYFGFFESACVSAYALDLNGQKCGLLHFLWKPFEKNASSKYVYK